MTVQENWREAVSEVWALFKETDERLDRRIKETDDRFKETEERIKETNKNIKELSGLFTSQWGKMVEALVEPTALKLFQERGIQVNYTYRRVEAQVSGETMELDLLLENRDEVVVIEVKSTLQVSDVRDFLGTLKQFPDFFPRYQGYRVYGGVAGLDVEENADKFAYRQGLFVLSATRDGVAQIKNDADFHPKDFGWD
ncbi:MAG: hypothetical protein MAG431_00836 [Chloroflexi bacterium]|nr:hypothetical protein [Chloroflexota bacterium]